jgi:hypothetical protein
MITVYTCDIIGSRNYKIDDRQFINERIKSSFEQACKLFPKTKADYLSFTITQGDEFQFTADKQTDFYKFLLYFRTSVSLPDMFPTVFFRCGIGFGDKATNGKTSYEMDGSAFYNARIALDNFKLKDNLNKLTRLHHTNQKLNSLLNSMLMFCDDLEYNWSTEQRKAILETLSGKTQVEIASELDKSQQSISKVLISAKWDFITNALQTFNKAMS